VGKVSFEPLHDGLKVPGTPDADAEYVPVPVGINIAACFTAEVNGEGKRVHERGNAVCFPFVHVQGERRDKPVVCADLASLAVDEPEGYSPGRGIQIEQPAGERHGGSLRHAIH